MAFTSRGTGRFSHKTHTVDGCGIAARAFDRRIYILRNFVHAAEDNNIFRSETERGKAVADAINIYQHTVFGNGVDAGKEEICQKPLVMQFVPFFRRFRKVAVNHFIIPVMKRLRQAAFARSSFLVSNGVDIKNLLSFCIFSLELFRK